MDNLENCRVFVRNRTGIPAEEIASIPGVTGMDHLQKKKI